MATSAFRSTTRRAPMVNSSPSTDDSASASFSSVGHRRSRSLTRLSRPIRTEIEPNVVWTPRMKFVNTARGSDFPEISLDDLEWVSFPATDGNFEEGEHIGSSGSSRTTSMNSEISPATNSSQRRSRSVSRYNNGATAAINGGSSDTASSQGRGRSLSRGTDGNTMYVPEAKSRRRRSVSVDRYHTSDSEIDRPIEDYINHRLYEAMRKELRSAVYDVMVELEQRSNGGVMASKRLTEEAEIKGINLPWLKWDTHDVSPIPTQDCEELGDAHSTNRGRRWREMKNNGGSMFDMDRYIELQRNEEVLFDSWRQRELISSGALLLCGNVL